MTFESESGGAGGRMPQSRQAAMPHKHPPYVMIAVWLLVITIAEVVWALIPGWTGLDIPDVLMVLTLFFMMFLKAAGVIGFYMHLKYDSRVFSYLAFGPFMIAIGMIVVFFALFGGFAARFS